MVAAGSDKSSLPAESWQWGMDYTRRIYEDLFRPLRDEPITFLELGWGEWDPELRSHANPTKGGRSAAAWRTYFSRAQIHVVDIEDKVNTIPDVHLWKGSQADADFLEHLHRHTGDFDVVIDDASHVSSLTIRSFQILWPYLKPGGLYVVEDLHSSYHDYYFGKAEANRDPRQDHNTAMGFFKRLADDVFYTGVREKGPAVDGDPRSWDCYPRQFWQGYEIETLTFAAPQAIVIRKRS